MSAERVKSNEWRSDGEKVWFRKSKRVRVRETYVRTLAYRVAEMSGYPI